MHTEAKLITSHCMMNMPSEKGQIPPYPRARLADCASESLTCS